MVHSRKQSIIFLIILAAILSAVFLRHISSDHTLLDNPTGLAELLGSYESGDPQEWKSSESPAMRYRLLFKAIIEGTAELLGKDVSDQAFYGIFVSWSYLLTLGCLIAFFLFLRECGLGTSYSFAGSMFVLVSFPVLFAYNYPVFVKEDILAYLWICIGLLFMARQNYLIVAIISVAAIATRETTAVLPFTLLIMARTSLVRRILYILPAIITFFLLRILVGYESYNMLAGFYRNLKLPLESLFFLFMTFGVLWLTAVLGWVELKKDQIRNEAVRIIVDSFPYVLGLMLIVAMLFSILRENRILFIVFPWMMTLSVFWIKRNMDTIRLAARDYMFSLPLLLGTVLICATALIFLQSGTKIGLQGIIGSHIHLAQVVSKYPDVRIWAVMFVVHAALTVFVLYSRMKNRRGTEGSD